MERKRLSLLFFLLIILCLTNCAPSLHRVNIDNSEQLKMFLKFDSIKTPIISAHRGGPSNSFPENSIITFKNTLMEHWAMMEIDPHYTKDSIIVLMHDDTIDRTTNGTGKVSDYTFRELEEFRLKDIEGNITRYKVPRLSKVIQWAKGKTILVLDMKDVSISERVKLVKKYNAQQHTLLMAYSFQDAKICYSLDSGIMMEVFIPNLKKAKEFEETHVPWENIVAFISHDVEEVDRKVIDYLHDKGVMCIVGSSRNFDKNFKANGNQHQLYSGYNSILEIGADIIETDLAEMAGKFVKMKYSDN